MKFYSHLILLALCLKGATLTVSAQTHQIWYDRPAKTWTQALPIGNGAMGGMVFGLPGMERIQINEETIWAGQPNENVNPEAAKALPLVRQLLLEGKDREAQQLANEKMFPNKKSHGMPYQQQVK